MTTGRYQPVDLSRVRTYSVSKRAHRVHLEQLARTPGPNASARELLDALPDFLGVRELRAIVAAVVAAAKESRPVGLALGGHVVKVGCSPIIIDLIDRGVVTAIAVHGATAIHDVELAMLGMTSEDVADTIRDGSFGMVEETFSFFADACALAGQETLGLGAAAARLLVERDVPHRELSILAASHRRGIPLTVHAALGTDTIHMAAGLDAAQFGEASLRDFRTLCAVVADLGAARPDGPGGVWINVGSAVILPEVFLKAVSVARNLGADLDALVTANLDMLHHYRPKANVVQRPVKAGQGHEVIGHHEILLPILRQAIVEQLNG